MKHLYLLFVICSAALAPWSSLAASPAATQEWVRWYVATNAVTVSTNAAGNYTWSQGEGTNAVSVSVEMPTVFAMKAFECDAVANAQGLTNDMTLVYHRPLAVFVSRSARIWVNVNDDRTYDFVTIGPPAMTSVTYNASSYLATGTNIHARIATTYVTPSRANAVTNGLVISEN
uniref:Uncharacterized protein n=1 Tax=uncultured bacterium fosmid pJB16B1 TaxID=1478054 RepID=A0A0H3UA82_9BACT|nr:hypothetical protein [uncultured bacterium fosmid pJB16B1]